MGDTMAVIIVAEAGINHGGNLDEAKRLCDAALKAGADIVKFQTWTPGMVPASLNNFWFGHSKTIQLARHCESIGIEFCSTPDDVASLRFLVAGCGVKRIKIGSGSLTYPPLVLAAIESSLPVVLSTGMATLDEIRATIRRGYCDDLTLLHCVSLYPCPPELANVKAMTTLRCLGRPVGYSDHTRGDIAACAAVALGARMIEKHLTLDRHAEGPDHHMSETPEMFAAVVDAIRQTEQALGDGAKEPGEQERAMIKTLRKDGAGRQGALL